MGSLKTFQVSGRLLPWQQPLPYQSNDIFAQKGVCKPRIPNLVATGPQRRDDHGSRSLPNWAQFYLPFSVNRAAEPSWNIFDQKVFSSLMGYFNFCFKMPGGITFGGVGDRKMTTIVIRASCFFLFKGKRLCLCGFLVIFPCRLLFVKGLEYWARGSDGEREFLANAPFLPCCR